MSAARKPNPSPEGLTANRPPVRYGAPAAVVLRAQTAAPSSWHDGFVFRADESEGIVRRAIASTSEPSDLTLSIERAEVRS